MKKKGQVFLAAALSLVIMGQISPANADPGSHATAAQSTEANSLAEKQFASAVTLLKQENFSDAIAAYEKVIQLLPESPIAQDARYWIGQTYFRMGNYDEALSVFKKLLKDYPESSIIPVTRLMVSRAEREKEAQKTAAKRSAAADQKVIIEPKTGAVYRKIHTLSGKSDVDFGPGVFLSPNGKFLLSEITVVPLDGQEPFALEAKKGLRGTWSPDGKMAAYYSENAIWIVPVSPESGRATGPSKKVLDGKYVYQFPVSWSPDSTKIVLPRRDEKTEGDLWILSIKDGALTRLTDDPGYEPNACWFPDGKTLVYLTRGKTFEIRSVPAAGGESKKIIGMEVGELHSVSPDGKWIAYKDRQILHLYRVADGRDFPIAPPEDVGAFFSWSNDGEKMLFRRSSYEWRTFLGIGSTSGGPSFHLARNFELWPWKQFWAAASDKITTLRAGDSQFVMISLSGGEPIPLELNVALKEKPKPLLLSPDRKYLLFSVDLENGNENLYTVPVSLDESGTTGPPVMVFKDWDRRQVLSQSSWSPDGRKIALIHKGELWVTSSKELKPVQLTMTSTTGGDPLWSPRGDKIGFVSVIKDNDRKLMVIPAAGGEPATPFSQLKTFATWCWSPDGKALTVISDNKMSDIPLDGGEPREILDLEGKGFTGRYWDLTWLPDGKQVAFIGEQEKDKGNSSTIYIVSTKTGKITELAADDKSWKDGLFLSPDGKWVSYYTDEFIKTRPTSTIWEVNVEDLIKGKK
jgi:Tol biopolymer transport system component